MAGQSVLNELILEPPYNEGPARDWQNWPAKMSFHYVGILFHVFYYYWGEEYRSTTTLSYSDNP